MLWRISINFLQTAEDHKYVVGSSCYSKNIGAKFTHLFMPSLCKEFIVMRHNLGHSSYIEEFLSSQMSCFIWKNVTQKVKP